jgi:hypothetical protein
MQFVLQNTQFDRRTEQGIITLVSGNTNSLIRAFRFTFTADIPNSGARLD